MFNVSYSEIKCIYMAIELVYNAVLYYALTIYEVKQYF